MSTTLSPIECGTMTISCSSIGFLVIGSLYYTPPSTPPSTPPPSPPFTGNDAVLSSDSSLPRIITSDPGTISSYTGYNSVIFLNNNNTINSSGLVIFSASQITDYTKLIFNITAEVTATVTGLPGGSYKSTLNYTEESGSPGYNDYSTVYQYSASNSNSLSNINLGNNSITEYTAKKSISDAATASFNKASEVASASNVARIQAYFKKEISAKQAALDPSKKSDAVAAADAAYSAEKKAKADAEALEKAKAVADSALKATDQAIPSIKDLVDEFLSQRHQSSLGANCISRLFRFISDKSSVETLTDADKSFLQKIKDEADSNQDNYTVNHPFIIELFVYLFVIIDSYKKTLKESENKIQNLESQVAVANVLKPLIEFENFASNLINNVKNNFLHHLALKTSK